jgi:vacuolar-type H+-ATPase subunit H
MKPSMPTMKRPDWKNDGYSRDQAENEFKSDYKQREQETQANINRIDDDRRNRKEKLQNDRNIIENRVKDGIKTGNTAISQQRQQIENKSEEIRQKEKERSEDGALWSATKYLFSSEEKGNKK